MLGCSLTIVMAIMTMGFFMFVENNSGCEKFLNKGFPGNVFFYVLLKESFQEFFHL
jgi:hypothetical protein